MKPSFSARLPMRVSAQILLSHRLPGEPVVVLMIFGVGTTAPYEFRDDEGRDYVCRWETKIGGHVMRVPAHLWAANNHKMARSCMERRRQQYPVVVGIELATEVAGAGSAAVGLGHQTDATPQPLVVLPPASEADVDLDFSVDSSEPFNEDPPIDPNSVQVGGVALHHIIAAAVGDGAMRIKSLRAQLGGDVTEDDIKLALQSPDSVAKLNSGWVSIPS